MAFLFNRGPDTELEDELKRITQRKQTLAPSPLASAKVLAAAQRALAMFKMYSFSGADEVEQVKIPLFGSIAKEEGPLSPKEILKIFEPEQILEMFECFGVFDSDGGGTLGAPELEEFLIALGKDPTKEEVDAMIEMVDDDGSGEIEFPEFLQLMCKKMLAADTENELRECFMVFDRDKSGAVTSSELKGVMNNLGEAITDEAVEEMISMADPGGDGELDVEDFINFVTAKGLLKKKE